MSGPLKFLSAFVVWVILNAVMVFALSFVFVDWWVFPGRHAMYSLNATLASAILTAIPVFGMFYEFIDSGYGMAFLGGGWTGGAVFSIFLALAKLLQFAGIVHSLNLEHAVIYFPLFGGLLGALYVLFLVWIDDLVSSRVTPRTWDYE